MAQNEMHGHKPTPQPGRTWRIEFGPLDLSRPTFWQTAVLIALAFTVGAALGLMFS
jgi:hypothetical protein